MSRPTRPEGWLHHSHKHGPRWFRRTRLSFFRSRRTVLANPTSAFAYRTAVAVLGVSVVAVGLVMVPLPGPGWLVVFLGVAIVASEFTWARRILHRGRAWLRAWTDWLSAAHWSVRLGAGLVTCLFVWTLSWLTLRIVGVPDWVPRLLVEFLRLS